MKKKPTLKDVAKRAGVSPSAVSRVFTPGASVSRKMSEKVEKAATELGYRPNALASSLTTGNTKLIGLVSNNFHNPLFLQVFDLFTRGLQDHGLRPIIMNLSDNPGSELSVRMLQQYSIDAVVVASSTLSPSFAKLFHDAGVPTVHCFGRNSPLPGVHVVGIDNVEAGRMAAQEFEKRGYKKVAFVGGPQTATSTQDRFAGFASEIAASTDLEFSYSFTDAYSFQAGRTEMQRLLKTKPAEAYFCGDDVLSIGALSAIEESGLNVPKDIGILGFNDMEMAGWENIGLTTIHQPLIDIVDSAIGLIVRMLADSELEPEVHMFPCTIVERRTLRQTS